MPQEYSNLQTLKEICKEIESKQEQIDQCAASNSVENPFLTDWLIKTAKYTSDILKYGESKIDDNITVSFIEEGQLILTNNV